MNDLNRTLLAGVALCALTAIPAAGESAMPFHFTALHGGRVINKTKLHNHGATHITSTLSVFTYVPASSYRKTEVLPGTFYFENYDPCSATYRKMKVTKKAQYGKVGIVTETYTGICGVGIKTVLYGNSYKLTEPNAQGKTDSFVSTLHDKFENNGTKYRGTLNIDVNVIVE